VLIREWISRNKFGKKMGVWLMSVLQLFGIDSKSRERRAVARHRDSVLEAVQHELIEKARSSYERAKKAIGNDDAVVFWLGECAWSILLAHVRGDELNVTFSSLVQRLERMRTTVLIPKLKEIMCCDEEGVRARLASQFSQILRAAIELRDYQIHDWIICRALDAQLLNSQERHAVLKDSTFLESLGFRARPHEFGVEWYLPRGIVV
jgi:hypothetical protein